MKRFVLLFISFFLFQLTVGHLSPVLADDYDTVTKQLEETKKQLDSLKQANSNNKKTLDDVNKQLASLKVQVANLEAEIVRKEKEVDRGEATLAKQKDLLDKRIVSYYKNMNKNSTNLIQIFAAENLSESLRTFFYQRAYMDEDKRNIVKTVGYIGQIENAKEILESQRARIGPIKSELDAQSKFLANEVQKADAAEGELNRKIADLSAKQQAILSARSGGGVTTSAGNVPISAKDKASTIAYKSQAPANSFAVFSFGGYTHRRGMSQYGAKARAESGQAYTDILRAYYPDATLETRSDLPGEISVEGYGSMSFEDKYLMGIAEMYADWPVEALKSQAIAARTYAYNRVRNGGSICATEACQVYNDNKANNTPSTWREAVQSTRGQILIKDGNPRSTEYSLTSGGWNSPGGWDTTDGSNNGEWTSRAYETKADSPWFYRAWYRDGYSDGSNSCNRAHPWLSQEEMSDIINAWIVRKNPNGADSNRIIPITINECSIGGGGGNPYSMNELRERATNSGGAVTSISSVTVYNNNSGTTTNVRFETNRGGIDIPGNEFKETFNIRAPGFIRIPQFGYAFFNIEKN